MLVYAERGVEVSFVSVCALEIQRVPTVVDLKINPVQVHVLLYTGISLYTVKRKMRIR